MWFREPFFYRDSTCGLGSLAPNRRSDIARMGVKAVLAGTLSNLMAATIAGFCLSLAAL